MRSSLKLNLLSNASIILVWKELSLTRLLLSYERNASTQSQRCFENHASVWLCVAFLRKDYYVCGEVGLDIRKRNVTYPDELKKYDLAVETAGAQSPIFA